MEVPKDNNLHKWLLMAELGTELPWESTSGEFCYLSNCGISALGMKMVG
jgi:hypothetical protein